ncbi:PPR domain-containing protein/PPR_1 domain-containing protein [Cephalotus follicularis]|uniref:PPR domain-containing protein/PPR_1 domain-containing protein n=1 Tax=Cephalotus follicularis TaxID=3775 RepID=A0A1Q3ATD3_CEPFO|nr:PPR domain-containing protein/PPR_1 domain-containing protein [Cephalotus follicularis]
MAVYQLFRRSLPFTKKTHHLFWRPSICLGKELLSSNFRPPCRVLSLIDNKCFTDWQTARSNCLNLISDWRTISSTYDLSLDFEGYGPCDTNTEFVNTDFIARGRFDDCCRNSLDQHIQCWRSVNVHKTFQSLLRAGDLDAAYAYAHTPEGNGTPTVFTCNAVIAAMINANRHNDAIYLFQYFFQLSKGIYPNVASFNLLIKAYMDAYRVDMALVVYYGTQSRWVHSSVMGRVLIKGLIENGLLYTALSFLRVFSYEFEGDSILYNDVIKGFLDIDDIGKANGLFEELKGKCAQYDGVLHATFMDWFFKKGRAKEGMEMYQSLLDRGISKMNPNTGNILLSVLLKHGKEPEAWKLFDQMLGNHSPPVFHAVNSNSYNIMVNECFTSGKYSEAIQVFRRIGKQLGSKPFAMDILGYNNIITKLCDNNLLVEAEALFEELISSTKSLSPNAITYRILIEAYFREDRTDDAFRLFTKMVKSKLWVTATFGCKVFNELVKNKKVEKAFEMLEIMEESDVKPDPTIYEILIFGLRNENLLDKSRTVVIQMLKHGVGLTPTLWKFLPEIFVKARWNNTDVCKQLHNTGHSSLSQTSRTTEELKAQDIIRKLEERVENMERKYAKMRAHMKAMKSTSSKSRLKRRLLL